MEENKRKRPGDHTVKERPRTPASRPRDPRPRTGNAASREAARRERLADRTPAARREAPAKGEPAVIGETPARREADPEEVFRHRSDSRREPAKGRSRAAKKEAQPTVPRRKKKKPHRVYNTNFGFKFVIMLSVVAVLVLSMIIFFKVKTIRVVLPTDENGQVRSYYTEDELRDASGINIDDNLLSLMKPAVAARIYAALPYINEVQIKKQLPGTVVISFSEFDVTYGIQDEAGGWWLMSREGRILEAADEDSVRGHLTVTGMPIQVPKVGDYIKPAATEGADMSEIANKQTVVLQVIPALEEAPFVKDVDRMDVSTSYDLTLWWTGGRYEIKLGTTARLEYKLQYLQTLLDSGEINNKSGTVDLTFTEDNSAHFLPFP